MDLSNKAEPILDELISIHREYFFSKNPGTTENDWEKNFLHFFLLKLPRKSMKDGVYTRLSNWIETIK